MKRIFILAIFGFMSLTFINAQQIPPLTQYYFNHYHVNPAATGITDNFPIGFTYRKIWTGITESPSVQYLTGNMLFTTNMGGGIKVFNYTAGPLRKTGSELTYSYHLELNRDVKLSFGLSGLVYQFNLNRNNLTFEYADDPVVTAGNDNMVVLDASFGAYLYSEDFYVGLSAPQLIGRNIDLKSDNILQQKQVRHYYLLGGYNYSINPDITLKPSVLMKFIEAGLFQVDVNAIIDYKNTFIGGIAFRSSDALIFQLGFNYEEIFFGYSYDLSIGGSKEASSGSHEVYIQYTLPNFLQ